MAWEPEKDPKRELLESLVIHEGKENDLDHIQRWRRVVDKITVDVYGSIDGPPTTKLYSYKIVKSDDHTNINLKYNKVVDAFGLSISRIVYPVDIEKSSKHYYKLNYEYKRVEEILSDYNKFSLEVSLYGPDQEEHYKFEEIIYNNSTKTREKAPSSDGIRMDVRFTTATTYGLYSKSIQTDHSFNKRYRFKGMLEDF